MSTSPPAPSPRPKPPLIAVIGTTGVGKTDLGVELAKVLSARTSPPKHGEVLNHDSMQCYRGLDVITNKATNEEMQGVPHHLMGFLEPGGEWGVHDFLRDALEKARCSRPDDGFRELTRMNSQIDDLQRREALPIAVGGTTYYLQNLVFPNQLVNDVSSRPHSPEPSSSTSSLAPEPKTLADVAHFPPSLLSSISSLPSELLALFLALPALPAISSPSSLPPSFPLALLPPRLRSPDTLVPALYSLLQALDPASAARWHWRDVRKVRRALDIVLEGRRWEDVREEQQARPSEGPRFRTLIFWLYAENEALHPRLDGRVDKMIKRGLLDEIDELWKIANAPGAEPTDYSKGIYQAIGYKEFSPYLTLAHRTPSLTLDSSPELRTLFDEGIRTMKTSTRQYAKRQVKWIKGKLLPAVRAAQEEGGEVEVVLLDASDLSRWDENVRQPAVELLNTFLDNKPLPDPTSLSRTAAAHLAPPSAKSASHAKRSCPTCTRDPQRPFMVEERQWDAHLQTKAHRMAGRKRERRGRRTSAGAEVAEGEAEQEGEGER
ncbi:tRNA dimethylallyltransferase, mitochondrial [Rhodotorula kratochvilovae]